MDQCMTTQTLFAGFYAIFWGSIMNVQGRWLMFQPLVWYSRIACRFALSFVVMTVLPVCYFVLEFRCLGMSCANSVPEVVGAVFSSLFIYVFYRFWMAVVETWPKVFYWSRSDPVPDTRLRTIDPSIERLGLVHGWIGAIGNLGAAGFFGGVALGVPWLIKRPVIAALFT